MIWSGGAKPNLATQGGGGLSALHIATQNGDKHSCELLIEHEADPNVRAANGETPIFGLLRVSTIPDDIRIEVIDILLGAGAEVVLRSAVKMRIFVHL